MVWGIVRPRHCRMRCVQQPQRPSMIGRRHRIGFTIIVGWHVVGTVVLMPKLLERMHASRSQSAVIASLALSHRNRASMALCLNKEVWRYGTEALTRWDDLAIQLLADIRASLLNGCPPPIMERGFCLPSRIGRISLITSCPSAALWLIMVNSVYSLAKGLGDKVRD
ncbi:hypothetical protein BDW62DRAFT_10795 [Aspergillus aurantiobrunneus]